MDLDLQIYEKDNDVELLRKTSIYLRRKESTRPMFSLESPLSGAQHLDSLPEFDLSHAGNFSNTELPIALRKGNRSCVTCHPIQNFVSYNHLSHVLHSFITKLSSEQIPTRVFEALCHPE